MKDDILKGRFANRVFENTAKDIDVAISRKISDNGFSSPKWGARVFETSSSALTYHHLDRHRFVDMRTRNTPEGKIKKKNYSIHNRIIFGHYNNIVRELSYGFTEAIKEELMQLEIKEKGFL